MKRTLIDQLKGTVGKEVLIKGWVSVRRDQGKMVFFDFRDRSGIVQGVVLPKSEAMEVAKATTVESAVAVRGMVNKRPERNVKQGVQNGDIELEILAIDILSAAETLPFELNTELNLDTHLDNLPLTLKSQRSRDIFTLQSSILDAYRQSLRKQGFTEFIAPALVGGDAEGGAAAFKVEYFNDNLAFLATSPQFYKQIMVNPFERTFTVAKIFRAERSATTRHLSEATCIDFEMGFINNERDVMARLEEAIRDVVHEVSSRHADIFERFGVVAAHLPKDPFPVLTLQEAQEILGAEQAPDMDPESERGICEWARKEKGSDFVFITRFPTSKRAFYTYEHPDEAPLSRGFDLLFKGLEINSGAQRIHNHAELVQKLEDRGLEPEKFSFYLQAFRYGMPPHGGCSTGLERFTARMLELPNVKEATSFPRDMTRIDGRLATMVEPEHE